MQLARSEAVAARAVVAVAIADEDVAAWLLLQHESKILRAHGWFDLCIDPVKRAVIVRGDPVQITFVEFEILSALAHSPGRVFTRDMLLTRVWGDSAYRDPRTIDVHIRHLREKLERDAKDPEYIFTVRGVGYRFRDAA